MLAAGATVAHNAAQQHEQRRRDPPVTTAVSACRVRRRAVALGTDGIGGDMITESQAAFFRAREGATAATAVAARPARGGVTRGRPRLRRAAARPHRGRARPPTSPCSTTPPRLRVSRQRGGTLDLRPVAGPSGTSWWRASWSSPTAARPGGRGAARRRGGPRQAACGHAWRTFRRTISPPGGRGG